MATQPKFTPGPWHYAGAGILMNDDGEEVALSPIYDDVPDGRLIAAAPDLATAARQGKNNRWQHQFGCSNRDCWHYDLDAALAKAEGRDEP